MGNTVAARQSGGVNRRIAVNIAGEPAVIDCPAWCERDHDGRHNEAEDIRHEGGHRSVLLPTYPAGQRPILNTWRTDAPFESRIFASVMADGNLVEELSAVQLRKLSDDLLAHAAALAALASEIEIAEKAALAARTRKAPRRGFVIPPSASADAPTD